MTAVLLGAVLVACTSEPTDRAPKSNSASASSRAPLASATATPSASAGDPGAPMPTLSRDVASHFARLSLACVDRPYPNKPSHVYEDARTIRPPREVTPAFYGCFDWHSAVHGHWAMVRLLATVPELPEAAEIRRVLDAHLAPELIAKEVAFLREERSKTFERPYGWGWALRLAAEVHALQGEDARRWESALVPLASFVADGMVDYLAKLSRPIREGTHASSAFSLVHALDYARAVGHARLAQAIETRARDFYLSDERCPVAYEPSGEDFISPCLTEADLMRRVLAPAEFAPWLDRFLPSLEGEQSRSLLEPVEVRDRQDPRIGHLIGLSLERAWCMRGIGAELGSGDPRATTLDRAARVHANEALRQMADSGYGGEHWLASFAVYLLTDVRPTPR